MLKIIGMMECSLKVFNSITRRKNQFSGIIIVLYTFVTSVLCSLFYRKVSCYSGSF